MMYDKHTIDINYQNFYQHFYILSEISSMIPKLKLHIHDVMII